MASKACDTDNTLDSAQEINSLFTAKLLQYPNINSLYSLNSSKIDFIPYQFWPVLKLIKSEVPRILIADGVGVGKTIEAGLILKELETRLCMKRVLVICPRPLITERKWQRELKDKFDEKFRHINGDDLKYCISEYRLDKWPKKFSKCIIPYSLFDKATADKLAELKPFPKFDLVIVDEAHHIKNPNTYKYKATRLFCDNARSVVMLTATPIQLGNMDLFTLLNVLRPDLVYNYDDFCRMAEPNPLINEAAKLIRDFEEDWKYKALLKLAEVGKTTYGAANISANPTYANSIRILKQEAISEEERVKLITDVESLHTFAPIINRTRRCDIGEFTKRKPLTLKVSFTDEQASLYNEILQIQSCILLELHAGNGLELMMTNIMRRAASCIFGLLPFLEDIWKGKLGDLESDDLGYDDIDLDRAKDDMQTAAGILRSTPQIDDAIRHLLASAKKISGTDPKAEELIRVIREKQTMHNNKIMVFSSFLHTLNYLNDRLSAANVRVGIIHGGVRDEERLSLRERFKADRSQDEALDVLLFSDVGCEGLDYQFCDCLINYDLPWNPQLIEQRIGRIDRNGQKSESISIINIITDGTIDCEIYERCLCRIQIFNSYIGDSEEILGEVTREIRGLAEHYMLDPQEREKKDIQIADNAIRKIQAQRRLVDEGKSLLGLNLSKDAIKKELQDATNIHLSTDAIIRLTETYLEKRLGDARQYILGSGSERALMVDEGGRRILKDDFDSLQNLRMRNSDNSKPSHLLPWKKPKKNPKKNPWSEYLDNKIQIDKITFDGEYASEHRNLTFIRPTHPLVRQAVQYFKGIHLQCGLTVQSDSIPPGEYPFLAFVWIYKGNKGSKRNCELRIITQQCIDTKIMLKLIYEAHDLENPHIADESELLSIHDDLLKKAKEKCNIIAEKIATGILRVEN